MKNIIGFIVLGLMIISAHAQQTNAVLDSCDHTVSINMVTWETDTQRLTQPIVMRDYSMWQGASLYLDAAINDDLIMFQWVYRGTSGRIDILTSNNGKNFTPIDSVAGFVNVYYLRSPQIGSFYTIAAGGDTSNVLYYGYKQTLSFTTRFRDSISLTQRNTLTISDQPLTEILIDSWYEMRRFTICTATGTTIIDVDNEAGLEKMIKEVNNATSFEDKLQELRMVGMFVRDVDRAEFMFPQWPNGDYVLEIYSDMPCGGKETKRFTTTNKP